MSSLLCSLVRGATTRTDAVCPAPRFHLAPTSVILSLPSLGRVAEWQTRWLQVPVSFGTWGFKSPFAHR